MVKRKNEFLDIVERLQSMLKQIRKLAQLYHTTALQLIMLEDEDESQTTKVIKPVRKTQVTSGNILG